MIKGVQWAQYPKPLGLGSVPLIFLFLSQLHLNFFSEEKEGKVNVLDVERFDFLLDDFFFFFWMTFL